MNPFRLGIIGCGYWGSNYVRSAVELPEVSLSACCDSNQSVLKAISDKYPEVKCVFDPEEVFADPEIEGVCIVTPAGTHAALTKRALESGKHVLVEKPFATDVDEAVSLVEIAKAVNKTLMVGHIYVYHPAGEKMRNLVRSGELGEIYHINCRRTSLGPMRPDVNVAWDLNGHDIYFIMYILGKKPSRVMAAGGRPGGNSRE